MNKYDIIQQFLVTKKMTPSQKERFFVLVNKELKKDSQSEKELADRLTVLEQKILKAQQNQDINFRPEDESKPDTKNERPKKPNPFNGGAEESLSDQEENIDIKAKDAPPANPKHLADFMSLFNKRDGFKYLTHDYDENNVFKIDEFLKKSNTVFEKSTYNFHIPKSLYAIIKQFAFDSKQAEWTSVSKDYSKQKPVKIGWATKELRVWSKKHQLHPIRNAEYKDMIIDFRRITRIEKGSFKLLINTVIKDIFGAEKANYFIEEVDLEKADFYSNVLNLKYALEAIFEEIKLRSNTQEKRIISIKYNRATPIEDYFVREVIISHENSYPTNELNLLLKEWQEKGNMGKIKKKLEGYCDWSVETMIENKPTQINILRSQGAPEFEYIENTPTGFTHILTFYYK